MKTLGRSKRFSVTLTAILALSLLALATPSFAKTPSKRIHMAGRVSTASANTIRNGKGAPTNAIGVDGDFYMDTLKFDLYGPKANGHWPAPVSLRGPAGTNGVNGTAGKNGASGGPGSAISVAGAKGPQGSTGAQGPQGFTGPQGVQGVQGVPGTAGINGDTGPAGPTGPARPTGPAGPVGSTGAAGPAGAAGPTGPAGATGNTGATGTTGAVGATGSTGPQGATGPSQMSIGLIGFPQQLKAGTGASVTSGAFGTFAPGKDYFVHLLIYGVRAVTDFASLNISLYALGGSPSIQMSYLISDGRSYRTGLGENDTNLDVVATIDGTSVPTTFQLGATISALDNTSVDSVTFAGTYVVQLVGSLT